MQALLWLRRARMKLKADSRGFSSIVGAIFAVLTMFFLVSTVFVWSLSQNTLYNEAVKQGNQLDLDRLNERVVANASAVNYTVNGNIVSVEAQLENNGPLSAQIVTLWVLDANTTKYGFNSSLNINLKPGNITYLSGSKAILVTLAGSSPSDSFRSWFISGRGNTISQNPMFNAGNATIINNYNNYTSPSGNSTWALVAQGIGAFAFDFTSFKYYNVTSGTPDRLTYSSGANSYTIPWSGYIAFSFNLTNFYPNGQNITLDGKSEMWSYFPSSPGQANGPLWYLANVNKTTGIISSSYSPITLTFNQTQEVFFAKQTSNPTWGVLQKNTLGAINLLLYGTFSGTVSYEYAQNIPFVSLYAKG